MRDLLYFVIGILLGLICIFFDGSAVMAEHQHRNRRPAGRAPKASNTSAATSAHGNANRSCLGRPGNDSGRRDPTPLAERVAGRQACAR